MLIKEGYVSILTRKILVCDGIYKNSQFFQVIFKVKNDFKQIKMSHTKKLWLLVDNTKKRIRPTKY